MFSCILLSLDILPVQVRVLSVPDFPYAGISCTQSTAPGAALSYNAFDNT